MDAILLDTDILSEVLKQRNAVVAAKAAAYLTQHGRFAISGMTRYEVRRGYLVKSAHKALARFERFCTNSLLLAVTDAVLDRAADLWVVAQHGGHPCGDADLIIAATAVESQRVLVTGNAPHFDWIPGLKVENWRNP